MTVYHFFAAACCFLLVACTPPEPSNPSPTPPTVAVPEPPAPTKNAYVATVEEAHQYDAFTDKGAVQFDIVLLFGGTERLNGTITALSNSTKARIDYKDGRTLIYDGDKVYAADAENSSSKRFAAYTWPYFFLFPYKMSDAGTNWNPYEQNTLNGESYNTQKLTFEAGTGDDPEDWYITYANPETNLIEVAAYIVTAGKTRAEAEEDPHAISYHNYKEVAGIPIAHAWKFWSWRTEKGLTEQLGEATLSNVRFVEADDALFAQPEGYVAL
jgi:hypothetical protein